MLMHNYGEGGWLYDGQAKINFWTRRNSFETKHNKYVFAVYLCHNNSFCSLSWFSTRSITCCFIKANAMFFISGVSLICINVNNFQDKVIFSNNFCFEMS